MKKKRYTIEVSEETKKEFTARAKKLGMKYDGFLRMLLTATKSEVGVKC